MAQETAKGETVTTNRRVEVLIAVFILLLFVGLAAGAYLVFSDKCTDGVGSGGGSLGGSNAAGKDLKAQHLAFKNRYRSSIFKNEKMRMSEVEETGEVHDNLRLHEFKSGEGKYVQILDHKEAMRSKNQSVFCWFRIDPCADRITLFSKMGHDEPIMEDQPEFFPFQKIYELISTKKKLTLQIYGKDGKMRMSLEGDAPNHRDSQWHQIGFTAGKDACIYLDGMKIACRTASPSLVTAITPIELVVGESKSCKLHLSNLFVSTDELSKMQASATYNDGTPVNPRLVVPGLKIWIPLQSSALIDMMMNSKTEIRSIKKEKQSAALEREQEMRKKSLLRVPVDKISPTFVF